MKLAVQRRSRTRGLECPGSRKAAGQAGDAAWRGVALRVAWRESEFRRRLSSAGGWSDSAGRVRVLRRDMAERLDLLHRSVGGSVYIRKPGVYI